MGVGGVGDVDHVDAVAPFADDSEAAGAGAREDARDEVRVAHSPNKMRAKRDGAELVGVGREDFAFGHRLGERIRAWTGRREREGFVGVGEVVSVVDYTRGAGVDEARDAVLASAFEERAGAEDVGAEKFVVAAPDPDFRGDVEDRADAATGGADRRRVVEGSADEPHTAGFEIGRGRAGEDRHRATGGKQACNDVAAEETGAAGDERGRVVEGGGHGVF